MNISEKSTVPVAWIIAIIIGFGSIMFTFAAYIRSGDIDRIAKAETNVNELQKKTHAHEIRLERLDNNWTTIKETLTKLEKKIDVLIEKERK